MKEVLLWEALARFIAAYDALHNICDQREWGERQDAVREAREELRRLGIE